MLEKLLTPLKQMTPNKTAECLFNKSQNRLECHGSWSILNADGLLVQFKMLRLPSNQTIIINAKSLDYFDSAGALALNQCIEHIKKSGNEVSLEEFTPIQIDLLNLIQDKSSHASPPPQKISHSFFYRIGRESVQKYYQIEGLTSLIGELSIKFIEAICQWRRLQWPNIIANINNTGIQALPILALLSLLIGVVLAYQMGLQLQTYGANIFISFLSGMAIFREFAPLITAIIVAGRTSSAFTAQIGSMQINEEIDALLTMGISPVQRLVLPKLLGLMFVFPLLIFWSDIFSLIGAMMMSKWMLSISYYDFLIRLKESVGLKQMMLGLYKAPAFALIIALVGCFQGFQVQANADSIGSQTTKSVVQSLFLIIIADAIFSIIYSWMQL